MNWKSKKTNEGRLGISKDDICANSRTYPGKVCMVANTWRNAEAVCSAQGAHLCTEHAISADVTKHSGCNYDNRRIFSSTKCATTEGGPLDGYKALRGKRPDFSGGPLCLKPDEEVALSTYGVRCCTLSDRALTPGASFLRFDESSSVALTNETGATTDYSDSQSDYYDDGSDTPSPPSSLDNNEESIKVAGPRSSDAAAGGEVDDGSSDDGKSLSGGAIAAIVIVILLAVVVAAVVGAIVGRRMLRTEQTAEIKAVPELVVDSAESHDARFSGDAMKQARLSVPSIRTTSYSSALDEPASNESKATVLTEDNGFVLDKDGSLRLHSVRRENPAYRTSVYNSRNVVGNAGVDTNTSL